MRLLIIAHDVPYPPVHGGRVDIWRRLRGLARIGARTSLVTWAYDEPSSADRAAMLEYVEHLEILPLERSWSFRLGRIGAVARLPLWVALRSPSRRDLDRVIASARTFAPEIVWLDGIAGAELAKSLATRLQLPLVVRSHNIEHRYHREAFRAAKGTASRLKMLLAGRGLAGYERKLLAGAERFYDISLDDLSWWRAVGLDNGKWLPPLLTDDSCAPRRSGSYVRPTHDILYLGNLHTENNIAALSWFLSQVLPRIRAIRAVTVLIAGRSPSPLLRSLLERTPGVDLLPDPPDGFATLQLGRVLINPTRFGSGVNMKLLDMMAAGRPVVTTQKGAMGLGSELPSHVHVAVDKERFAQEVLNALDAPPTPLSMKELDRFGPAALEAVVEDLHGFANSRS